MVHQGSELLRSGVPLTNQLAARRPEPVETAAGVDLGNGAPVGLRGIVERIETEAQRRLKRGLVDLEIIESAGAPLLGGVEAIALVEWMGHRAFLCRFEIDIEVEVSNDGDLGRCQLQIGFSERRAGARQAAARDRHDLGDRR